MTYWLFESILVVEQVLLSADSEAFNFTCLLHTYFQVPNILNTTISGLGGLQYVDKVLYLHNIYTFAQFSMEHNSVLLYICCM